MTEKSAKKIINEKLRQKNMYSKKFATELYSSYVDEVDSLLDSGLKQEEAEKQAFNSLENALDSLPDVKENKHLFSILVSVFFFVLALMELVISGTNTSIIKPMEIYVNIECCLSICALIYLLCTRKKRTVEDYIIVLSILISLVISVIETMVAGLSSSSPDRKHTFTYTYPCLLTDTLNVLDRATSVMTPVSQSVYFYPQSIVSLICVLVSSIFFTASKLKDKKAMKQKDFMNDNQ